MALALRLFFLLFGFAQSILPSYFNCGLQSAYCANYTGSHLTTTNTHAPRAWAFADFNGDEYDDLIIDSGASAQGKYSVSVIFGNSAELPLSIDTQNAPQVESDAIDFGMMIVNARTFLPLNKLDALAVLSRDFLFVIDGGKFTGSSENVTNLVTVIFVLTEMAGAHAVALESNFDLDCDGHDDIALLLELDKESYLFVIWGNPPASFIALSPTKNDTYYHVFTFPRTDALRYLASGHLENDGHRDLLIGSENQTTFWTLSSVKASQGLGRMPALDYISNIWATDIDDVAIVDMDGIMPSEIAFVQHGSTQGRQTEFRIMTTDLSSTYVTLPIVDFVGLANLGDVDKLGGDDIAIITKNNVSILFAADLYPQFTGSFDDYLCGGNGFQIQPQAGTTFMSCVAGDLNNDKASDFLCANTNGTWEGALIYGHPVSISTTFPAVIMTSDIPYRCTEELLEAQAICGCQSSYADSSNSKWSYSCEVACQLQPASPFRPKCQSGNFSPSISYYCSLGPLCPAPDLSEFHCGSSLLKIGTTCHRYCYPVNVFNNTFECALNGEWLPPLTSNPCMGCNNDSLPENVTCTDSAGNYGDICTITCPDTHYLEGPSWTNCTARNETSAYGELGRCIEKGCDATLPAAEWECGNDTIVTSFKAGVMCNSTCSNVTSICSMGNWSVTVAACPLADCPAITERNVSCTNGNAFGSNCSFTCEQGQVVFGGPSWTVCSRPADNSTFPVFGPLGTCQYPFKAFQALWKGDSVIEIRFNYDANFSTDCDAIFDPNTLEALGPNRTCVWVADFILNVSLTTPQSNLTTLYFKPTFTSEAGIPMVRTDVAISNVSSIYPYIVGPTQVSPCGTLKLDGSYSRGPYKYFTWNHYANNAHGIVISDNTLIYELNVSGLTPGYQFNVSLTLGDVPSSSPYAKVFHTITMLNFEFARVTVIYPLEGIYTWQPLTVTAKVEDPCNSRDVSNVTYLWSQPIPAAIEDFVYIDPRVKRSSQLYLPEYTLLPGKVYTFQVQVFLGAQNVTQFFDIKVLTSPLKAIISGGDQIISRDSIATTTFDGSMSYDPNQPLNQTLGYSWICMNSMGNLCWDPALDGVSNTKILNLTSWDTAVAGDYKLTLIITKGKRTANTTINFKIITESPSVKITSAQTLDQFDPIQNLVLVGVASFPPALEMYRSQAVFRWSSDTINLEEVARFTSLDSLGLELGSRVLGYGKTYNINFSVTLPTGTSNVSAEIKTLSKPIPGVCAINLISGIAFSTNFTITCNNWTDHQEGYPLRYAFLYRVVLSEGVPGAVTGGGLVETPQVTPAMFTLHDFSAQKDLTFVLPPGQIVLTVQVQNKWNTITEYPMPPINVALPDGVSFPELYAFQILNHYIPLALKHLDLDMLAQGICFVTDYLENVKTDSPSETVKRLRINLRQQMLDGLNNMTMLTNTIQTASRRLSLLGRIASVTNEVSLATGYSVLNLANMMGEIILNSTTAATKQYYIGRQEDVANTLLEALSNIGVVAAANAANTSSRVAAQLFSRYFVSTSDLGTKLLLSQSPPGSTKRISYPNANLTATRQLIGTNLRLGAQSEAGAGTAILGSNLVSNSTEGLSVFDSALVIGRNFYLPAQDAANNRSFHFVSISFYDTTTKTTITVNNSLLTDKQNQLFQQLMRLPLPLPSFDDNSNTNSLIKIVIPHQALQRGQLRKCEYWDEASETWKQDGCLIDYPNSNDTTTTCLCSHLTSFSVSVSDFVPSVNYLSDADIHALTPSNVSKHPSTLIAVCVIMGVYLLLLPFAIRKDKLEKDEEARIAHLKRWEQEDEMDYSYYDILKTKLRSRHIWWAPLLRKYGDDFNSKQRLATLFTALSINLALAAIFFGNQTQFSAITVAAISSTTGFTICILLELLFSYSGERGHRGQFRFVRDREIERVLGVSIPYQTTRLPSYVTYVAYTLCLLLCIGAAFILIAYGVRFDTARSESESPLTWEVHNDSFVSGSSLRVSYDSFNDCKRSCMNNAECEAIVIRHGDQMCYELGKISAPVPNPSYDLYILHDGREYDSTKWITSSLLSVLLGILFEALKLILVVSIYWCVRREYIRTRQRHFVELTSRKAGLQASASFSVASPSAAEEDRVAAEEDRVAAEEQRVDVEQEKQE